MKISKYLMVLIILLTGLALVGSTCATDIDIISDSVCDDMNQNNLNINDSKLVKINNLGSNFDNDGVNVNSLNQANVKSVINNITYGDNISGYVNLIGHKGIVTIYNLTDDNSPIYANVSEDGTFSVEYLLDASSYKNVFVSFESEDGNFTGSNYVSFTVNKAIATIEVFCNNTTYMEEGRALVRISNITDDWLDFVIDDMFYTGGMINDNELYITYPWSISAGLHYVNVYVFSNPEYGNFDYNEVYTNFTVYKANPSINVIMDSSNIQWGYNASVFVTLPDYVTGNISYSVDNETWINLPVDEGLANFTFGEDLDSGNYILFVKYLGDDNCNSVSYETPFTVEKIGANIIMDNVVSIEGDNVIITANVVDDNGNPVLNGIVSFELDGETYTADVVDGVATFEVTMPPKGNYSVMIYFNGEDTNYNNASSICNITSNPTPPTPTPTPDPTPVPGPNSKLDVLDTEISSMENSGNPLLVLLITLSLLGIGSFKRKF